MPLLGADVRRKRKQVTKEAHGRKSSTRSESTCHRDTGTSSVGVSWSLSKRQHRPGSNDPSIEAHTKKMSRRLERAITVVKELERRVEEMASSSTVVKEEADCMWDEARRARDKAVLARDEVARLWDKEEGLNAEASMAEGDASIKDAYKRHQRGYPIDCDEATSVGTDNTHWSDDDDLMGEPIPQLVDSTSTTSPSMEEVETAYDITPLAMERPNDDNNVGEIAIGGHDGCDGVGEMTIGGHDDGSDEGDMAIGGHELGNDGWRRHLVAPKAATMEGRWLLEPKRAATTEGSWILVTLYGLPGREPHLPPLFDSLLTFLVPHLMDVP